MTAPGVVQSGSATVNALSPLRVMPWKPSIPRQAA
nr:MAG TPA: hypothetical protein [Caudoviricetes sp.]